MKSLSFVTILVYFLFCSCKKENILKGYFGTGKATINGSDWTSKARGLEINNTTNIDISLEYWNGLILKNEIFFTNVIRALGKQKVNRYDYNNLRAKLFGGFKTHIADGDVICDIYEIDNTDTLNNLTITSYNETTKELRGTFKLTCIRDTTGRGICDPSMQDTLRIENGQFYTKIF